MINFTQICIAQSKRHFVVTKKEVVYTAALVLGLGLPFSGEKDDLGASELQTILSKQCRQCDVDMLI